MLDDGDAIEDDAAIRDFARAATVGDDTAPSIIDHFDEATAGVARGAAIEQLGIVAAIADTETRTQVRKECRAQRSRATARAFLAVPAAAPTTREGRRSATLLGLWLRTIPWDSRGLTGCVDGSERTLPGTSRRKAASAATGDPLILPHACVGTAQLCQLLAQSDIGVQAGWRAASQCAPKHGQRLPKSSRPAARFEHHCHARQPRPTRQGLALGVLSGAQHETP